MLIVLFIYLFLFRCRFLHLLNQANMAKGLSRSNDANGNTVGAAPVALGSGVVMSRASLRCAPSLLMKI